MEDSWAQKIDSQAAKMNSESMKTQKSITHMLNIEKCDFGCSLIQFYGLLNLDILNYGLRLLFLLI